VEYSSRTFGVSREERAPVPRLMSRLIISGLILMFDSINFPKAFVDIVYDSWYDKNDLFYESPRGNG